jgi:hypothetical protein
MPKATTSSDVFVVGSATTSTFRCIQFLKEDITFQQDLMLLLLLPLPPWLNAINNSSVDDGNGKGMIFLWLVLIQKVVVVTRHASCGTTGARTMTRTRRTTLRLHRLVRSFQDVRFRIVTAFCFNAKIKWGMSCAVQGRRWSNGVKGEPVQWSEVGGCSWVGFRVIMWRMIGVVPRPV